MKVFAFTVHGVGAMQPRLPHLVLGLLLAVMGPVAGCKHNSNWSSANQAKALTGPQQKMIDDLKAISRQSPSKKPDSPAQKVQQELDPITFTQLENATSVVINMLSPQDDGTFQLGIDDQAITVDPRPQGAGDFTDFFTALKMGVDALVSAKGAQEGTQTSENIGLLLAAYRAGDLNLDKYKLSRETKDENFKKTRKLYILASLARMKDAPPPSSGALRTYPVGQSSAACERKKSLVSPSIVAFKRGDLDRQCGSAVDRAISQGFARMTLFFPIHLAGTLAGPGQEFPSLPVVNKDYRFERLLAPTPGELRRCVGMILDAGMELTYVPHIESIVTMLSRGESEWRLNALFSPDDPTYFALTYEPALDIIRAKANRIRKRVTISVAAEVDMASVTYIEETSKLAQKIRARLGGDIGSKLSLSFNPNGDFNFSPEWVKPSLKARDKAGRPTNMCDAMQTFLTRSVDRIAPSMYDSYHHIAPFSPLQRVSFKESREQFFTRFETFLALVCDDHQTIKATTDLLKKRFDIGEFSLQVMNNVPNMGLAEQGGEGGFKPVEGRMDQYKDFFEQALAASSDGFGRLTLWTEGNPEFDPLAGSGKERGVDTAKQVLDFVSCK